MAKKHFTSAFHCKIKINCLKAKKELLKNAAFYAFFFFKMDHFKA